MFMPIGIDELDDELDDEILTEEPSSQNDQTIEESSDDDDSFMLDFLRSKGINDPDKIMFENESGDIETRSWNDLTREEQINILNTPVSSQNTTNIENSEYNFSQEELNLLDQIRQSGLSPQDYINQLQNQEIEPTYKVDDLSDDELYLLDLESRVGELDENSAAQALSAAKQNEDLYKKQIEGIRKEYKEREDLQSKQEQAELEMQQQEAFEQYQAQVVDAIDSFKSVGDLDLNFEDSDKEELAEFMLMTDESGENKLYKALQDPKTLVKAAWFILNGDEAFNSVADYFKNQIKLVSEHQYKKGLQDATKSSSSTKPTVVISKNNLHHTYNSIDDLSDDDE